MFEPKYFVVISAAELMAEEPKPLTDKDIEAWIERRMRGYGETREEAIEAIEGMTKGVI